MEKSIKLIMEKQFTDVVNINKNIIKKKLLLHGKDEICIKRRTLLPTNLKKIKLKTKCLYTKF